MKLALSVAFGSVAAGATEYEAVMKGCWSTCRMNPDYKTTGFCEVGCGFGGYCCRKDGRDQYCSQEMLNSVEFPLDNIHLCVRPKERKYEATNQECLSDCESHSTTTDIDFKTSGKCESACGAGGYCCRQDGFNQHCSREMINSVEFSNSAIFASNNRHFCVKSLENDPLDKIDNIKSDFKAAFEAAFPDTNSKFYKHRAKGTPRIADRATRMYKKFGCGDDARKRRDISQNRTSRSTDLTGITECDDILSQIIDLDGWLKDNLATCSAMPKKKSDAQIEKLGDQFKVIKKLCPLKLKV